MRRTKKQKDEASYRANRAAQALRYIDAAYSEAEGTADVDMSGATVKLREALERHAAAAGFPASAFYDGISS